MRPAVTPLALAIVLWHALPATAAEVLAPDAPRLRRELVVPEGDDPFWPSQVLHGATSSPKRCAAIGGAVWAAAEGGAECLRTFGRIGEVAPEVMVYLHGDFTLRNRKGEVWVAATYSQRAPAGLEREAAAWSKQAGLPALHLGRPGTLGSSGDHKEKAKPLEAALIDAALEQIKRRHGVQRFHLAGQSGGGHNVAALLARRRDIGCAVIASGPVAQAERYKALDWPLPEGLYDPVDDVEKIAGAPRILVLSDPADKRVPYASQRFYVDKLRAAGREPLHIRLTAKDKEHHGLVAQAKLAAALCAKGVTDEEIARRVGEVEAKAE